MEPLLTLVEVSELLRINVQTARRWCREGKLPAVKLGKAWKVKPEDVEELTRGDEG